MFTLFEHLEADHQAIYITNTHYLSVTKWAIRRDKPPILQDCIVVPVQ